MFDIGFSEVILLFVVGLVVLGPKRLPIAIKTVMGWVRTIRGLAANVQNELAQELKLQELQESIKKAESLNLQALSPELAKTVNELKESAEKMKAELDQQAADANKSLQEQIAEVREKNYQVQENPENLTAVSEEQSTDSNLSANNLKEQMEEETDLDVQLAKYIDEYHPAEDSPSHSFESKSEQKS